MSLYIVPPYHLRYPAPSPGPIPRSKKEWVPCRVCYTLFMRRRGNRSPVTCHAPKCVNLNIHIITRRTAIRRSRSGWWRQYRAQRRAAQS